MTDPKTYIGPAEEKMEMAVAYLDETLARIRAGKANAKILDGVRVEYYGSMVPVSNVANISVPDARTIAITPWEKAMFKAIEKAIINSEVGITPENNGEIIRLSIPPLSARQAVQGRGRERKGIRAQRPPRRHRRTQEGHQARHVGRHRERRRSHRPEDTRQIPQKNRRHIRRQRKRNPHRIRILKIRPKTLPDTGARSFLL